MQGYKTRDVAKMLDLSPGQVRSYARAGFLEPARGTRGEYRFSFQDIVLLRTAQGLKAARIPPKRLREALCRLKVQLPTGHPLSSVNIRADGDRVVVRHRDAVWNPESGQTEFNFEVADLVKKVAPHARRAMRRAKSSQKKLDADSWYELGFDLEAAAPEQAMEAYRKALELDSEHVDARVNLGRLLHVAGKLNAAEAQFRIALASGKPNATALFNLGVALEDLGRTEEALRCYRETIDTDPECVDAYFNLARLLEGAGDRQTALRYLTIYRRLTDNT